jgi:hypothetical protein
MRKFLLFLAAALLAAPAAASAQSVVISFRTPSGNIGCVYAHFPPDAPNLRCDIRSGLHNPKLPSRGNCNLNVDFGQGLWIADRGPAHIVCAGDTALDPHATVLPYGTTVVRDGFSCQSETIGLTCKNRSSHGFFLNADVWRLF